MFIEVDGHIINSNFVGTVSTVDEEDNSYYIVYTNGDVEEYSCSPNDDNYLPRGQLVSALLSIGRNNNT